MKSLKTLLLGVIIGAAIAFPLGVNFGKGAPLFSNPFEKRSIKEKVKEKVGEITESAREKIHDATKPLRK